LILAEQKKSELAQQKKEKKVASKVASVAVASVAVASVAVATKEVEDEADVVKKINFEGKKYLKSKNTGIIYNMDQDVIGKWNEEKQRIDFNEQDEESEDEYDEDE
jgi:outer membrane protein assembly factor BamA